MFTVNVFLARKLTKHNFSISKHIWILVVMWPYQLNTTIEKNYNTVILKVGSYYIDSIFKSEAGSILVSCFQNLFLDFSESLIFLGRQVALLREKSTAM